MPEYWCYKADKHVCNDSNSHHIHLQSQDQFGSFVQNLYQFSGTIVSVMENAELTIVFTLDSYLDGNTELDRLLEDLQREFVILEKW
ncbi:hypothetical protein ACFQPF_01620 [Fictibacillus iocasae]|uniref:Uncharacterized protein n=1 Tax=Fictibacillus iocasae TaxID=2715437 RepID=A0ABW2NLA0_9BACL